MSNIRFEKDKILIVDDIPENIKVAATVLKMNGYRIYFAQDGKEALKNLENYHPDLILLDVMMPVMSGFEVCEKIKANPKTKDIPVIFLTAKNEIESLTEGFKRGGVDYIVKPFNSEELVARVKTHLELQKQKKELIMLNQTKDKLFSIIAHDLKNPFQNILGFWDLLIGSYESLSKEDLLEFFRQIYQSMNQGYILLENLLNWASSQTNRITYLPQYVDIGVIIRKTSDLLNNQAIVKNITITKEIADVTKAYCDPNMITTVLRNLLSNAIKFTNENGEIKVKVEELNNELIISVTDNGIGIPKENIELLFKENSHFSTPGTSNEIGTGLGLVLCKEFVARNGGKIKVESIPNSGSTFSFTLPLQPSVVDTNENLTSDESIID